MGRSQVNEISAVDAGTDVPVGSSETAADLQQPGSAPVVVGRRGRGIWIALVPGMIALLIVLVFAFQNLHNARVHFLGFSWNAPVGLAMISAALLGGIVVFTLGSIRILQLRKLSRGHYRKPPADRP
jgi:lipopolysaccharide assembly protein A